MYRGIRFQIPNEYGKFIAGILEPIDCVNFEWRVDFHTEIWKSVNGKLGEELFPDSVIKGADFFDLINSNTYYLIFANIQAYPEGSTSQSRIHKYEDFIASECQIIMLVADSSYVDVYCKEPLLIEKMHENAKSKGFESLKYIDENDSRTGIFV
ncbi:DUF2691 family protein [Sporomusa malonica]|uniref:DUF2691 domain-containing protein n=1 Tax=Sporomusa malonica TaxID=112901 RepID=A0A1W2D4X6_9FIRM|nr:DUF2691 family protein [Sporomusa malonica]SMC92471.1 Protein of unknown function [Sporomusa malonica]